MRYLFALCALGLWLPAARAAAADTVPLTYTLPKAAQVSINIYDAGGRVVRELLHAAPRAAGKHAEPWDAKDDDGKPVPAGPYTWKLLATQGVRAEYLLTLGANPKPDWLPWPANHNGPAAMAVDERGDLYFVGGMSEGPPLMVKQTAAPEEKRLWTIDRELQGWNGGHSLSVANGRVYMLQNNGRIQVVDAATGRALAFWQVVWEPGEEEDGIAHEKTDIAARGDTVVRAYQEHDCVRWVDPLSGAVLDEAAVPEPLGVTVAPDGRVLVISQRRVVALTRQDKTPRAVITGLTAPWRLTVDSTSHEIYVVDGSAAANPDNPVSRRGSCDLVKRFAADGKLLQTYKARPHEGRYEPDGFADVRDIEEDRQGGFFVAEPEISPRRIAHFRKDGTLLREWYGGQQYANFGGADPEHPADVWIDSAWGELVQARVDYRTKTWRVHATYRYDKLAGGLVQSSRMGDWLVRHHGGRTYLLRRNWPQVLQVDEANRRLIPHVVTRGTPHFWKPAEGFPPLVQQAHDKFTALSGNWYAWLVWTDRNGDGQAVLDEIEDVCKLTPQVHWSSSTIGPDFTYYIYSEPNGGMWRLGVKEWLPHGTPVYDFAHMTQVIPNTAQFGHQGAWTTPRDAAADDYFAAYEVPLGDNKFRYQVARWLRGTLQWAVGRPAAGTVAAPGEIKRIHHLVGTAHGCLLAGDYADSMVHIWDADGLWVGRVFDHPDLEAAPREAYRVCGENFAGSVYQDPKTGDVFYYGGGDNATPVFRLTGWNTFAKQQGTLTVPAALAERLAAEYVAAVAPTPGTAIIPRVMGLKADGDLADWKGVAPLKIMDGKAVLAQVRLAWNPADGLFAAFDVTTKTPWKTAANARAAFEGGAAIDLCLGPVAPAREAPVAGDYRVVVSPIDGQPRAVVFMPVLAPGLGADQQRPETYKTGLGEVTFARVDVAPQPAVVTVKPDGSGYTVEMQVPVYQPLALAARARLRLDLGVILSNAQGNHSTARVAWHSTEFADTMTYDTFTQVQLRPHHWGEAILE